MKLLTTILLAFSISAAHAGDFGHQQPPQRGYGHYGQYGGGFYALLAVGLLVELVAVLLQAQAPVAASQPVVMNTVTPTPGYCYPPDHPLSTTASSREACALFDLRPDGQK